MGEKSSGAAGNIGEESRRNRAGRIIQGFQGAIPISISVSVYSISVRPEGTARRCRARFHPNVVVCIHRDREVRQRVDCARQGRQALDFASSGRQIPASAGHSSTTWRDQHE